MESFNRVERGYDPEEVNSFLDQVIEKVELLVEDLEKKDTLIKQYQSEITRLKENNGNLDSTINETIITLLNYHSIFISLLSWISLPSLSSVILP